MKKRLESKKIKNAEYHNSDDDIMSVLESISFENPHSEKFDTKILVVVTATLLLFAGVCFFALTSEHSKISDEMSAEDNVINVQAEASETSSAENAKNQRVTTTTEYNPEYSLGYAPVFLIPEEKINSPSIVVYDVNSNTVLYSRNPDEKRFPASITKLLTASVALTYVDPSEVYHVGHEINKIAGDSSRAGLTEGEDLTLEQLIYALMLPSGNDAAYTVAVNTARKVSGCESMPADAALLYFSDLMNDFAYSLGTKNTHFVNPDGYQHENHYTCSSDMVMISMKAMSFPLIAEAVTTLDYNILNDDDIIIHSWTNNNKLVNPDNEFYYPYCKGLKTGFTDEAGCTMCAYAEKDGRKLIVVTMGCTTNILRYRDVINMFNAIFDPAAPLLEETTPPAQTTFAQEIPAP